MPNFEQHQIPLWYCVLMMAVLFALFRVVRTGLDRSVEMSRVSRAIRVFGAGFWMLLIIAGMILQVVRH